MKNLKKLTISAAVMSLLVMTWSPQAIAQEKGSIELKMVAEKEIVVENENGEKEIKREAVDKVIPGDHVVYTIEYKNVGEEAASSVVINNPVPENMHYVAGTATGDSADIVFSVDGGQSFDKAENLKVMDEEGKERPATAKDYTHIRWNLVDSVATGAMGQVAYRAELQ